MTRRCRQSLGMRCAELSSPLPNCRTPFASCDNQRRPPQSASRTGSGCECACVVVHGGMVGGACERTGQVLGWWGVSVSSPYPSPRRTLGCCPARRCNGPSRSTPGAAASAPRKARARASHGSSQAAAPGREGGGSETPFETMAEVQCCGDTASRVLRDGGTPHTSALIIL